jgi:small nuclear ribonucleoprotein (snRNP)-like protein
MSKFALKDPFDLIKLALNEKVLIKLKGNREIKGQLHVKLKYNNKIGF